MRVGEFSKGTVDKGTGAHIRQLWKRLWNGQQRQRETSARLEAVGMDLKEGLDGARRG